MTVSAVVFDLGGVITESPMTAFAAYEEEAGLPPGLIRQLNSTDPDTNAWARYERNELDADGFVDTFEAEALAAGHRVDARRVLTALSGELRPIVTADDLWADEMVARIAARLGFTEELAAAVAR